MKKLIKMYNEKYGNTLGIIDDDFNKEQMYRIYYFIKNNCDDKDIQERLAKIKLDKPKTLEQQLTKLESEHNNGSNANLPYTISSKVLATVPASNIVIDDNITVNNASIKKDRRYYIEFLGNKKLCSLLVSEELGNCIMCSIGNYSIQAFNNSTDIMLVINKINKNDTTVTFTDLIIHEEEIKYLDNKYLETDLVLQNSVSLGRVGEIGACSSAVGCNVIASGVTSHAIGTNTTASGNYSHTEGDGTTASGNQSHAEGYNTIASGDYGSHVEGYETKAEGESSHAEGYKTKSSGMYSHSEGIGTIASGSFGSHAEGFATTSSGKYGSHAEGGGTLASSDYQHVQGKYNIEDTEGKYAHIVGNGTSGNTRSNAHTLDWKGNAWYAGKLSQEGTPTEDKDLVTKKYVDDKVSSLPQLSFNDNGELVVTINGVSKTFVPKSE